MSASDPKLFFFLFLMSIVVDVLSRNYGKLRVRDDMKTLPSGVKCIGKSRGICRVQYYFTMFFVIPLVMAASSALSYSVLLKETLLGSVILLSFFLLLVLSIRMIVCMNISWICYDDKTVYWRKWSDKTLNTCDLQDVINYRSLSGVGGHLFYLVDGRVLIFYNLCENLEDMCNKSGIVAWRKKNEGDWPFSSR